MGTLNRMTAKGVGARLMLGRYADGGGLYLNVSSVGKKSWLLMYRSPVHRKPALNGNSVGREREMGLGPVTGVSLAQARELAEEARRHLRDGMDPLDMRHVKAAPSAMTPTFGTLAEAYLSAMSPGWRNEKHRAQWHMTLTKYAAPLRDMPVDKIEVADVLACLAPHWSERPETADRLRGRIERVLDSAKAAGHRSGENPAAWRGHLENLLPKRQKLSRGHHDAMSYDAVPAFMATLRKRHGISPVALEFTILTAARSGEVRGARWAEIDRAAKVWTIPAIRMKAGKEHRVPLLPRMIDILDTVTILRNQDDLVFPGTKTGKPLSDMSLSAVLRRMGIENATPHGFRSAFRDWAGSETPFARELAEEALAHVVGDKVERAYRRGDALEKRRDLMAAWEAYCDSSVLTTATS